jgi:hypothetical protein
MRFPPEKLYFSYKMTIRKAFMTVKKKDPVSVHGFNGSGVRGWFFVAGFRLGVMFRCGAPGFVIPIRKMGGP